MSAQFVDFEPAGHALIGRIVAGKITEREAGVIADEVKAKAPAAAWRVALDLSDVALLASAGLGSLLAINRACADAGGRLAIFGLNDDLAGVMKIARLDRVLTIKPGRDDALKALA